MPKINERLLLLFGILLGLAAIRLPTDIWLQSLFMLRSDSCENPNYQARIISFDPLILHLENFVTESERRDIVSFAQPKLKRSVIVAKNGTTYNSTTRTSSSALVFRNLTAARCVMNRITSFQGFVPTNDVENLQLTAYQEGQQFKPHLDWITNATTAESMRWQRTTTGFAILEANCQSCGTQFPLIKTDWSNVTEEWCRILDCDQDVLTVKPLAGSLLFWQNIRSDGLLDKRMVHAGLPAEGGSKIGLNIWTKINLWERHVGPRREAKDVGDEMTGV